MMIKVIEAPSFKAPVNGQQAVTASAAPLVTQECIQIIVKALSTNTISVFIGNSGVTTANGFELAPGDWVVVEVEKAEFLYVIASTTGASVCWLIKKVQ